MKVDRQASLKSQTDFARLDAMDDSDIDLSDIPEVPPEMFGKALTFRFSPSSCCGAWLALGVGRGARQGQGLPDGTP